MEPIFVLSYPRCRTAWLATYLTGAGVFCFHEAWREVSTAKALRKMMEAKGDGPVVNADCSNWFFVKELAHEFPNAKYLILEREWLQVARELDQVFGIHDWTPLLKAYERVKCQMDALTVSLDAWTPEISLAIFRYIAGNRPLDYDWHRMMHRFLIQVTKDDVRELLGMAADGRIDHLSARLTGG